MARKRRVPEVLWRIFHNRARTLGDTIISLIPSSPPSEAKCRCKGRKCLGCSGDDAMSFLLRPEDPSEYRKLLTQCFVVVSDNAPTLSAFSPDRRWSQHQMAKQNTGGDFRLGVFNRNSRKTLRKLELLEGFTAHLI
ncbi:RNA-directed DNA polymerase [Sarracenia purpurea var. burkii]